MNKYKIGYKLVCIDDRDSLNLALGHEYQITDINEYGNIQVVEADYNDIEALPHFYKPSRFDTVVDYEYENLRETTKKTVETKSVTFDPSKKYKTRNGREFRFIGFSKDKLYPIVGEVFNGKYWGVTLFSESGRYCNESQETEYDLIEVADKIQIKIGDIDVAVYDDKSILFGNQASSPLTNDEIDAFIEALETFRD
jgi:hypothetical protein